MSKTFPWMLSEVPWPPYRTFIRGYIDGLPLLSRNCAPREILATYRQLRAMQKRPGGADPVAVLYTKHSHSGKTNFSSLWLIAKALPIRPMTSKRWEAVMKALTARRICPMCDEDTGIYLSKQHPWCDGCRYQFEKLEPWDHLYGYLYDTPEAIVLDGYTEPTQLEEV